MANPTPYTWVEFLDDPGSSVAHRTNHVRINGQDVLVTPDVALEFGAQDITRVTVTLLPNSVTFCRAYDDAKPPALLLRAWHWLRDRLNAPLTR